MAGAVARSPRAGGHAERWVAAGLRSGWIVWRVVSQAFEARETAAREAAAKATLDQVAKLTRLAARAKRTAESGTVTLREGERLLRDITTAVENVGKGETTKEIGEALAALRTLQEQIARRVKELRDLDEWRRFANVQQQEELIAMAEAIVASLKAEEEAGAASDLAATAKRCVSSSRDGRRSRTRRSTARGGCGTGSRRRPTSSAAAARSTSPSYDRSEARTSPPRPRSSREAEALADSTDWSKTAARFQELQKAWEDTGPVPGDAARNLAQRFRAACNTFFTRRRDVLSSKKKEWDENLARKEALCERAEQLAESTEWDAAASEVKKLQAEWKTIGPVRHDKSEVVWNRFRSAADKFFERYHNRHQIAAAEKLAEHEALVVALESLAALEEAPADLAAQVQTLRTTISNAPHVEGAGVTALARTMDGRACRAGRRGRRPRSRARTSTLPRTVSAWKGSSRRSSPSSGKKRPSRRRTSPPPSCSRSGCDRRSRAMRWVFAPTTRSGVPPAKPSKKRRRRGSGSSGWPARTPACSRTGSRPPARA